MLPGLAERLDARSRARNCRSVGYSSRRRSKSGRRIPSAVETVLTTGANWEREGGHGLRRSPAGRLGSLGSARLADQALEVDESALLADRAPRRIDPSEPAQLLLPGLVPLFVIGRCRVVVGERSAERCPTSLQVDGSVAAVVALADAVEAGREDVHRVATKELVRLEGVSLQALPSARRSATAHELDFRGGILRPEVAHRDSDPR